MCASDPVLPVGTFIFSSSALVGLLAITLLGLLAAIAGVLEGTDGQ